MIYEFTLQILQPDRFGRFSRCASCNLYQILTFSGEYTVHRNGLDEQYTKVYCTQQPWTLTWTTVDSTVLVMISILMRRN